MNNIIGFLYTNKYCVLYFKVFKAKEQPRVSLELPKTVSYPDNN